MGLNLGIKYVKNCLIASIRQGMLLTGKNKNIELADKICAIKELFVSSTSSNLFLGGVNEWFQWFERGNLMYLKEFEGGK